MCLQAVYTASVSENLPVNSLLLRIGATDADIGVSAWIQYSLHGPGSQDFSIDPDTGKHPEGLLINQVFLQCLYKLKLANIV